MTGNVLENSNLLQQYDDKVRLYQSFANEVEHLIRSILNASNINCNAISSRIKTRDSIAEKIRRKGGKYSTISDITDVVGVRIITYYSDDVDKVAKIIESEFDVDKENSIDKRATLEPDRFGYCSVHYVVMMSPTRLALRENRAFEGIKFEIQIRSVLQHAWAEIEHDIGYKSEVTIPPEMRRSFSRIAGLLEIADKEFNQIRQDLVIYKQSVQTQIAKDIILDHDLDGVILEVLVNSNPEVQELGQHISNLLKRTLSNDDSDDHLRSTIKCLNWLGIKTVRQLNTAISKYSKNAKVIASELLKDYHDDSTASIGNTISLFYLSYAILLSDFGTKEQIYRYFKDNSIGLDEETKKLTKKFLNIKTNLNI